MKINKQIKIVLAMLLGIAHLGFMWGIIGYFMSTWQDKSAGVISGILLGFVLWQGLLFLAFGKKSLKIFVSIGALFYIFIVLMLSAGLFVMISEIEHNTVSELIAKSIYYIFIFGGCIALCSVGAYACFNKLFEERVDVWI